MYPPRAYYSNDLEQGLFLVTHPILLQLTLAAKERSRLFGFKTNG